MVVFWEPQSMGGSSSITFFKVFQFPSLCTYHFIFNFSTSMRVSLLGIRLEVKAIKIPEPFYLFGLIFVLF